MSKLRDADKDRLTEQAFEKSHADRIADAEIVPKEPNPTTPISIRLSAPLLERVDRIAATEGRTRSNLIQRALWEYIRSHKAASEEIYAAARTFTELDEPRLPNETRTPFDAISVDRENLEFVDALRCWESQGSPAEALSEGDPSAAEAKPVDADCVFDHFRIDDNDESWGVGELNVKIIHRGRIRINRNEWQHVIDTCSVGFVEDGVRKDFHLNILLHPSNVRLIYISYRYKQSGDKQRQSRRGILLDEATNIRELMMHLAYWFTAQPYAEKNYPVWKKLVEEAMTKLRKL